MSLVLKIDFIQMHYNIMYCILIVGKIGGVGPMNTQFIVWTNVNHTIHMPTMFAAINVIKGFLC